MAIIGTFSKDGDTFNGSIRTLTLNHSVTIEIADKGGNDKAPDYRIVGEGGEDFGAAWSDTSKAGNDYLQVKLDCPGLPSAIHANLIKQDGQHNLIWTR